jgi:hypothetical protein
MTRPVKGRREVGVGVLTVRDARLLMTLKLMKRDGINPEGEPLPYTACGLNDVYLVNGFTRETIDGEQFTTIENMEVLWKAIGCHFVTKKKVLAPKEIKYLRGQIDLTQAELAPCARFRSDHCKMGKGRNSYSGFCGFHEPRFVSCISTGPA